VGAQDSAQVVVTVTLCGDGAQGPGELCYPPDNKLPVNFSSSALLSFDATGDGFLDLALPDLLGGSFQILAGSGDGTFQALSPVAGSENVTELITGDLNSDGEPDLVALAGANGASEVRILLGSGGGAFGPPVVTPVAQPGAAGALADFDADSKPDLALAISGSATDLVLFGDGLGGFSSQLAVPNGGDSFTFLRSIHAADFNGDGAQDLLTVVDFPLNLGILLGNGDGSFQPLLVTAVPRRPRSAATGDLNGDSLLDLAVGVDGGVDLFLGNGQGGLQLLQSLAGGFTVRTALLDLDGDALLDLTAVEADPSSILVALGNVDGTLQAPARFSTGAFPSTGVEGEFTGDGLIDLIALNNNSASLSLLPGDGTGAFATSPPATPGANEMNAATLADFNEDGLLDLLLATDIVGESAQVRLGNGPGSFGPPSALFFNDQGAGVATGDVDADGDLDFIVTGRGFDLAIVFLNNGNGTFNPNFDIFNTGRRPGAVLLSDLDGDGALDLLVHDRQDATVSVLLGKKGILGDPNGNFDDRTAFAVGRGEAMAAGDVDGDGDLDIVTADTDDDTVSVLLGNGDGSFQPRQVFPTADGPAAVALGDIDGDGDDDVAVASPFVAVVGVLRSNGDGTLQPRQDLSVGRGPFFQLSFPFALGPSSVALSDLDGDGALDLICANQSDNLSILRGLGDGTFAPQRLFATGAGPTVTLVARLNADALPDLLVLDTESDELSVLLAQP
jgi:hypothetical protein